MKILFFTENTHYGGLDNFLISLINHWPHTSDELVLICNRNHPGLPIVKKRLTRPCRVEGHDITLDWYVTSKLAKIPLLGHSRRIIGLLLRYPFFLSYVVQLMGLFRRETPDCLMIVNGGYPAGYSNRAAAIAWGLLPGDHRSIHNFHNIAVDPIWWNSWIEDAIDALVHRYTRVFISTSDTCAQSIRVRPAMAKSDKLSFIFNGTEPAPESTAGPNALKRKLNIPDDGLVCSMLGTYEPRKGHEFLLNALSLVLKRIPNAYLVVTGYGLPDEVRRVESLVDKMGLSEHVRLLDSSIDKHELYAETDVLVAGSQAYESFGLTLIEAMSHKVPVVATRVGGMPEVMGNDEAGYSIDKERVDEFADKIVLLLGDEDLRRQKGADGHQLYLDTFTVEKMAVAYAGLIRGDEQHTRSPEQ